MSETTKIQIDQDSMKMQLYPNAEQREIIDRMLRALHVAYNITFHEVFQKNDAVCTKPNKKARLSLISKRWPKEKQSPLQRITRGAGLSFCSLTVPSGGLRSRRRSPPP